METSSSIGVSQHLLRTLAKHETSRTSQTPDTDLANSTLWPNTTSHHHDAGIGVNWLATTLSVVSDFVFENISAGGWTVCAYNATDNISSSSSSSNGSCTHLGSSRDDADATEDMASVALATFLTVVAATLAAFTAGTNLLVILAFKSHKRLQTVSNYFLVSLSVADLAIGALSMPLFTLYLALGHWPLGNVICDIWLSIDYTVCNASVANLLLICLDRYLSISHPLSYRARRSGRLVVSMIMVAWLVSFLLWTPWIVAWQFIEGQRTVPPTECYIQFLYSNQYVTVGTAMLAFYMPVSVMCALYWRIYARTRRRQNDVKKLQAFKFKVDHTAAAATSASAGTTATVNTTQTTSPPSTGHLANNNNDGNNDSAHAVAVVGGEDGETGSDLEQLTTKVTKVRGLERESSVVTFSLSVLSSSDRPPHTHTALTLMSCEEYDDVSKQFQRDDVTSDSCDKQTQAASTTADACLSLLQNGDDHATEGCVTKSNGVEFHHMAKYRRSAPDIWAWRHVAMAAAGDNNNVRGSKSHDDLECDLNLDLGVCVPAVTLMRWPSVAEMRLPASQQQAAAFEAIRESCSAARREIVPVSAQEYLYHVEMDDMSNSGMTYTNTGDFDDSTSDNGTSSTGYHDSHLRVNSIAGESSSRRTFCSVLATKFVGGGGIRGANSSSPRTALYTRRLKRRQAKVKESKAAKTLSAILAAFIVTWLPYNVFILFEAFSPGSIPTTLYNAGYWLCYINSTVNPVCYVLCNANFRRALKNLVPGLRKRVPPPRLFPPRRR